MQVRLLGQAFVCKQPDYLLLMFKHCGNRVGKRYLCLVEQAELVLFRYQAFQLILFYADIVTGNLDVYSGQLLCHFVR